MSSQLITVFMGDYTEALLLQVKLEAHGVPALMASSGMGSVYPFINGQNAFAADLRVPASFVEQARELLLTDRQAAEGEGQRAVDPETGTDELDRLGRRIRWASLLGFTAPYGLYLSVDYLARTRYCEPKPAEHDFTIASIGVALAVTLVSAMLLI